MKNEEYIADFYLVSRRHLTPEEWEVFRYHFLLGADSRLCTRKLKIDRGQFFHMVYRIEAKLGRVFRELQPYSLYPLDEYFYGRTENPWKGGGDEGPAAKPMRAAPAQRIPVKKVA
ncbi:MAG: hypothetical protein N2036_05905 [Bryobacteraceae bacterium]|nr:hypothetical protein [Bryobacteraceae bacterium]MCX7603592.1 hypothetical protein [Bryobacteraceae bacterium]